MRLLFQIHVALLLAAVVFSTLAGHALPHRDSIPGRNAGCHSHGKSPDSAPVSYRCCQNGHDSALVQSSEGPRIFQVTCAVTVGEPAPVANERHAFHRLSLTTGEPPGLSPLRI